jgi:hypothetical protein
VLLLYSGGPGFHYRSEDNLAWVVYGFPESPGEAGMTCEYKQSPLGVWNLALYFNILWRAYCTGHFWIPNLTCSGTGDAVRFVNSFYYGFTSRHYNFFYNVRSSLPCWFFISVSTLIAVFLVAVLTLWRCVSELFLWSPLIGSFDLLWSARVFIPYRPEVGCSRPGYKTPCRRVTFRQLVKLLSREQLLLTSVAATLIVHLAVV